MVTDRQVRKLRLDLARGMVLSKAAARWGMDEKTARRYRDLGTLPSEMAVPHTWRTRKDPFEEVWTEVYEQLEADPELRVRRWLEPHSCAVPGRKTSNWPAHRLRGTLGRK